jgi:hypothetical protein
MAAVAASQLPRSSPRWIGDPPPVTPRSIHIHLITACVATVFLLQNERPLLRLGLSLGILASFCALALFPVQDLLGLPVYLDGPARAGTA